MATRQWREATKEIGRQLKEIKETAPDLYKLFRPVLTDPEAELNPALRKAAEEIE